MSSENATKKFGLTERNHATSGRFPEGVTPNEQFYLSQVRDWDARKCEAFAVTEEIHPLLQTRAFLMRGRLAQAEVVLSDLKEKSKDPDEYGECLLEETRLAAFKGDWSLCAEKSSIAMKLSPSAVSVLTLLQLRSLAYFELGEWNSAKEDLNLADSLASVFNKSASAFYVKILDAKIAARLISIHEGKSKLTRLWSDDGLDLDKLLTLLRSEIDIARLSGEDASAFARGCLAISEKLGDDQYRALSILDLHYSFEQPGAELVQYLSQVRRDFERVERMIAELEMRNGFQSETVRTIKLQKRKSQLASFPAPIDFIWVSEQRVFCDLKKKSVIHLEKGRIAEALSTLACHGKLSKTDFFKSLWGNQKYAGHLHDSLIYNLFSRIRSNYDLGISIKEGIISLDESVLVC